jgi:pyruvyltransferase
MLKLKWPLVRNFGDLLSPFIVSRLAGVPVRWSSQKEGGKLLAVGSILFAANDGDTIWGSGFLHSGDTQAVMKSTGLDVRAVRGPRTRDIFLKMGKRCPEVYGDPALLLPRLIANDLTQTDLIGLVPHFNHFRKWRKLARLPGVRLINVDDDPVTVIRQILQCRAIFSSSLHGLIVAEAYGIPARHVVFRSPLHGELFKFEDYFWSQEREHRFVTVQSLDELVSAIREIPDPPPAFRTDELLASFPLPHSLTGAPLSRWSLEGPLSGSVNPLSRF